MPGPTFVSFAQNREDVVLHRALALVESGNYVEVGANDPTVYSISRGFYDLGWSGLTIDPVRAFADAHRAERPRDTMVEVAVTDADVPEIVLHQIAGTGLSTLDDAIAQGHQGAGWAMEDVRVRAQRLDSVLAEQGWQDRPIHFMVVDVEGAENSVLRSIDLAHWRPWVLVIEATRPLSTEPAYLEWEPAVVAAGYEFTLFDGISRFYVADEHRAELGEPLGYPACARDRFRYPDGAELDRLRLESDRLRTDVQELAGQIDLSSGPLAAEYAEHRAREAAALESSAAWRVRAVASWAAQVDVDVPTVAGAGPEEVLFLRQTNHHLTQEFQALQNTLSWRITRPLRLARRLVPFVGRG